MRVEILGTGCAKCKLLEKRVKGVIQELGRNDIEIAKIEDIGEIMSRGIMMTPGLSIDGEIKIAGRMPSDDELKKLLQG
jgi:small redox-active disulfide protein 2